MTRSQTGNNEAQQEQLWGWTQEPAVAPLSRKMFIKWLQRHGAGHYAEDATLCFMELLSNALRIPSPDRLTHSNWLLYEDRLRVEVKDYSDEAPFAYGPDVTAERGRGLILVHLLADKWGYDHCSFLDGKGGYLPGKWVWFELHK